MYNQQQKPAFWTYQPDVKIRNEFPDPRIAIARHTGWTKTITPETEYAVPEPDNFNRAVYNPRPVDCEFIEDQVMYYDRIRKCWITVFYVPDELIIVMDAWIAKLNPLAFWQHIRPPKVKPQRSLLWTRTNISEGTITENERLYTMGYFETLKLKYFSDDTEYVDSLLGPARAELKNLVQEELDDSDYCDN